MNPAYATMIIAAAIIAAGAFIISDRDASCTDADANGTDGNIDWDLTEGVLTLSLRSGHTGTDMNNYTSTNVPWNSGLDFIAEVIVGDGITSIGTYAFSNCRALISIAVPDSVTAVGAYAFYNCLALSSVNLASVAAVGDHTFQNCRSLTSVDISAGATSIGDYAFDNCRLLASAAFLGGSLTAIGDAAFQNCSSLTSVDIPAGAASIGDAAFQNCSSLTSVAFLGGNLTSIGDNVFAGCTLLTSLDIPAGVASIGDYAFYKCQSLTSVDIPAGAASIGAYAAADCSSLTSVAFLGGNLTSIREGVFSNCNNLTSISIPSGVASIGDYAFYKCRSLTSISIPSGVSSMGAGVFQDCNSLASISIPAEVASIGDYAFGSCRSLASVEFLGGNLTSIREGAFYDCYTLASIDIPAGVTAIGNNAFSNCFVLASVTFLGNNMTSLGDGAFTNCPSLASISIPAGVASIGSTAFERCISLTSVEFLGSSMPSIKDSAFQNCSSLASIDIPVGVESIGSAAFSGCSSLASAIIPAGVATIGNYAFNQCSSLASIDIPAGAASIGDYAFSECIALRNVRFDGSAAPALGEGSFRLESGIQPATVYIWSSIWTSQSDIDVSFSGAVIGSNTNVYYGGPPADPGYPNLPSDAGAIDWDYTSSTGTLVFSGSGSVNESGGWYELRPYVKHIVIGADVTAIGNYAFRNYRSLVSVTFLGNNVASIGFSAFSDCVSLTSIAIPSGVTAIGSSTFHFCRSLTSVDIPAGVTSIGGSAFSDCCSLTSIDIPDSVTSIGGNAFTRCYSLTSVDMPAGATSIGHAVFSSCYSLASIDIPAGVASIEINTFTSCTALSSVVFLGNNVASIGNDAFMDCRSLTSIDIPAGVTSIGGSAFSGCYSLASVNIPAGVTSIGGSAFFYCTVLTAITIPMGATSIGGNAFSGCCCLAYVDIPDSVTSIGSGAFSNCHALLSIDIPAGVAAIGDNTFTGCHSLASVAFLGDNVASIGNEAFYDCYSLASIDIPAGATSIGKYAFTGCISLKSIVIPAGVASIRNHTFMDCRSLESVMFQGSGLTSLGEYAFYQCHSLASVDIPAGVTYIGEYAFSCCYSLTSAVIPGNVTDMGSQVFGDCCSLTSATILSPDISFIHPDELFSRDYALTAVSIYNPDIASGTGTQYNVAAASSPRCILVYFDAIDGGLPVYAEQSPTGAVSLSGFTGAVQVGTAPWGDDVATLLSGGSFERSGHRILYASEGATYAVTASANLGGKFGYEIHSGSPTGTLTASDLVGPVVINIPAGMHVNLKSQADPGFRFLGWDRIDGAAESFAHDPITASSPGTYTVSFNDPALPGSGYSVDAAAGANGSFGYEIYVGTPTGTYVSGFTGAVTIHVPAGQNTALIGTPASGYQFEKWNDGTDDISHNPITVSAAGSYTASFAAEGSGYNVTVAAGANGSFGYEIYAGMPTGTYVSGILGAAAIHVPAGQNTALIGTPASGYQFEKWNDGTDDISHNPITVSAAGSRTVSFSDSSSPSNGYNVTVAAGANGSSGYEIYTGIPAGAYVSGLTGAVTMHVPAGQSIALIGTPASGYQFEKWNDGTDDIFHNPITASSPGTYTVSFNDASAPDNGYIVDAAAGANGSFGYEIYVGTPTGTYVSGLTGETTIRVPAGQYISLIGTPASGYQFEKWNDGTDDIFHNPITVSAAGSRTVSFSDPSSPSNGYNVTVAAGANGSFGYEIHVGTPTGTYVSGLTGETTIHVPVGQNTALIGTPASGYQFEKWNDGTDDIFHNPITVSTAGSRTVSFSDSSAPGSGYDVGATAGANGSFGYEVYVGTPTGTYVSGLTGAVTMHVPAGQNIILLGTPASGYQFEKWNDGTDDIFHNPITVSTAGSYEASFIDSSSPSNGYNVTVAAGANGSFGYEIYTGTPTGSYVSDILGTTVIHVPAGQNTSLIGTPASGYQFEKWNDGADDIFHNPITVSAAGSRTVSFIDASAPDNGYIVDATAGANGSFGYEMYVGTPTGTYVSGILGAAAIRVPAGQNIALLGTPTSGYQFEKWNDGTDDIFHNPITVSTAGSYEASFIDSSSPSNGYNVTAAADANGKVQYATSGSTPVTGEFLGTATIHVNDGETVTLTGAATAANYAFEKWTQTSPIAAVFSHNPMTVSTAGSYEASFIDSSAPGSGYDVDATAGANGSFGYEIYVGTPTGTYVSGLTGAVTMHVPAGQNIILLGTPLSGYQFEKWNDGADDIFHNPITVSAAGSRTVSFIDASAPDNGYIVDAAAGANGSFGYERYAETPTGAYVSGILGAAAIRVPAGQNIALLGTPLSGYQFEKWNDGADDIFHNPITVSAAGSRTVSFSDPSSPSNGYNVDVTAGANGSFGYETYVGTPTGTYVSGFTGAVTIHVPSDRNISLAAIADAGYRFVKWQKDGIDYSTTAVINLASADAGVYEASFTEAALSATYTISAYADGGSEITPSGSVIIAAGKNATFTFTAKEGYAIADVIVDGAGVPTAAASGEYTFYNVGSNHTVSIISEISVPAPGGGGDDAENNPGGNGALSDAAVAAAVVAIVAVAVAAGAAILWFAFGPGRTFEVIKIPSGALIIGRDRAYYGKAYNFETDGGTNVRYRIGKDETWKEPIRTYDGYEIPKEEVTGTVTIEVD